MSTAKLLLKNSDYKMKNRKILENDTSHDAHVYIIIGELRNVMLGNGVN